MNIQHFFNPFPVIDLGNFILREIRSDDAKRYLEYMSNPIMANYLTEDNLPKTIEKSIEEMEYWGSLFSAKKSFYWAIATKNDNKMIGTAGFNTISFPHNKAEISYDLDPEFWGQGVMLKAIKNIMEFASQQLQLVRVQATVITDNDRSIKLLERCNFKQEGLLEKFEIIDGVYKDYFMYAHTP